MTKQAIIKALKSGPKSSKELADQFGLPRATVISAAQDLRDQGIIKTGKVKVGRFIFAEYTLLKDDAEDDNGVKYICGIPTYGIFSKAEYAVMKQQASRLFGKQGKKEITNNQFIWYNNLKHG